MGLIISSEPVTSRSWVPGFFTSFREHGLPTLYGPNKTPVTVDVTEVGFVYAIVIVAISFLVILPGIRGWERLYVFVRFSVSLFIGGSIMLGLWGNYWEVGYLHTHTQYRAFTGYEIEADIGLKIGLHNMNITLKGTPIQQQIGDINETINYNERFWWSFPWSQQRIGFGKFSSEVNQEFREAQYKGVPYPILWIAEYFIFDGEGIRWGRFYRHAGFYTHIVLWLAFPLWVLSNVMFFVVPRQGAYFLGLTGVTLISGNIIYATLRNPTELQVPFEDGVLKLQWGANFWLNVIAGAVCVLLSAFVYLCDSVGFDSQLASFFGTNELRDVDEYYLDDETEAKKAVLRTDSKSSIEEGLLTSEQPPTNGAEDKPYSNHYARRVSAPTLKKRGFSKVLRKSAAVKKPRPVPRKRPAPPPNAIIEEEAEDGELYENLSTGVIRFGNQGVGSADVNVNFSK